MIPMDMLNELQYKIKLLDACIKELAKTGKAYAQAEKEYKMAVCKKALELKDSGMAVTLIQLVIYGYPEIANLRFKRDSSEAIYRANQESINATKIEIKILQDQINKEYGADNG